MSTKTSIEWTDVTDNVIVAKDGGWWCRMISPGCANCYAARLNQNTFYGGNRLAYRGESPPLRLRRDIIDGWKRQTRPRRHFVASMTDVFGEWIEREWIFYFLDGMAAAPRQTFQLLTKRPAVAAREIAAWLEARGLFSLPLNVWIGTSVEDQTRADERIPLLLSIPARVLFLSCEPLLGPVALWSYDEDAGGLRGPGIVKSGGRTPNTPHDPSEGYDDSYPGIDWVICGGESGPGARPMHPDWARSLRDQCAETGVPFFFKQWGAHAPHWHLHGAPIIAQSFDPDFPRKVREGEVISGSLEEAMVPTGKRVAGRLLDGAEHNGFPTVEVAA